MKNYVLKEDEYIAEAFKIAGFAMMTPFGKFILELRNLQMKDLNVQSFLYTVVAFWLLYLGIIAVFRGAAILKGRQNE